MEHHVVLQGTDMVMQHAYKKIFTATTVIYHRLACTSASLTLQLVANFMDCHALF